eukprot:jgi/Galph1/3084/GphlegSOOS_G1716.1
MSDPRRSSSILTFCSTPPLDGSRNIKFQLKRSCHLCRRAYRPSGGIYCQPSAVTASQRIKKFLGDKDNANIFNITEAFRRGEWKATEITQEYLQRILAMDKRIGAFLTVDAERALERAEELDMKWKKGKPLGALAGVPFAIKDNLCTKGMITTAGSKILENFIPAYNATAINRLEEADAIVIGKTNMDEFGMGSSTELSAFHTARNPWNLGRVCGGSSGGSAAAVASGMAVAALGSDTGGSIRQPASFCGVCGLKPTYGLVSRFGLVAFSSSLDTVGPMASTVAELASIFKVLAGNDPMDGTCLHHTLPNYDDILQGPGSLNLSTLTIGVVQDDKLFSRMNNDVINCFMESVRVFQKLHANLIPVSLPFLEESLGAYYVIAPSEASSNLARYDGVRYGVRQDASNISELYLKARGSGLGNEVKRRILTGTFALSSGYYDAYYRKALQVRSHIIAQFSCCSYAHSCYRDKKLFEQQNVDIVLTPTAPSPAFEIGEKLDDPVKMYLEDVLTIPASLAGLPALSVPMGFDEDCLPIGLQLIGNRLQEDVLFRAAHAFQLATNWHEQMPTIYQEYISQS